MNVEGAGFPPVALVPCRIPRAKLRERPPAEVVKAVASRFYFLRQQKRSRAEGCAAEPDGRGPRRRRPLRLRDRVRAISHRLRKGPHAVERGCDAVQRELLVRQHVRRAVAHVKGAVGGDFLPLVARAARKPRTVQLSGRDAKMRRLFLKVPVPDYVLRIYEDAGSAKKYFDNLCLSKGLFGSPFYREALRWGSLLDDLVLVDKIDMFTPSGVKVLGHAVDKLHAMEVALGPVTGVETLHLASDLVAAFDFLADEAMRHGFFSAIGEVLCEARRRDNLRKRLNKKERRRKNWPKFVPITYSRIGAFDGIYEGGYADYEGVSVAENAAAFRRSLQEAFQGELFPQFSGRM